MELNESQDRQNLREQIGHTSFDKENIHPEYVNPYFKHDQDGNIEYAYTSLLPTLGVEKVVHKLDRPITEDDFNKHLIMALDWYRGGSFGTNRFLEHHFNKYRSDLNRGDSDQPFFQFLGHLITTTEHPVLKNTHDAVINWIETHPCYERIDHANQSDEMLLPPGHPPLTIRQVALWHIYEGKTIESGYKSELIAKNFGYTKPSSGRQLRSEYKKLVEYDKRIDKGKTPPQLRSLIEDIQAIEKLLKGDALKIIKNEILTLKLMLV